MYNEISLHAEHAERRRRLTADRAGRSIRRSQESAVVPTDWLGRGRRSMLGEVRHRRFALHPLSVLRA